MIQAGVLLPTIRAIISNDFALNLRNNRYQNSFPLTGLLPLIAVFVGLSQATFSTKDLGISSALLSAFLVFWTSVVVIITILPVYGISCSIISIRKGIFLVISSFLLANMIFFLNVFWGTHDLYYVGETFDPWLTSLLYSTPYAAFCLVNTCKHIDVRKIKSLKKAKSPRRRKRILEIFLYIRLQAHLSALILLFFATALFKYLIADLNDASQSTFTILLGRVTAYSGF